MNQLSTNQLVEMSASVPEVKASLGPHFSTHTLPSVGVRVLHTQPTLYLPESPRAQSWLNKEVPWSPPTFCLLRLRLSPITFICANYWY